MDINYYNNINSKNQVKLNFNMYKILFSIIFSLFIIGISINMILSFKPLYYFDIEYLNIVNNSGFSEFEIIENYNYIIDYLLNPNNLEFNLPTIPYSKYGVIHFNDVKNIFIFINSMIVITGVISISGIIIYTKKRNYEFLKTTSDFLITLTIILIIFFITNFDIAFNLFHKIFFRNEYWLFNPKTDPTIKILPQEFFYHAALLIIFLIILSVVLMKLLYKNLNGKAKS